ncbi:MAG: type II secretion system minor pseudopilin GspH [Sedimenticola sp.]
MKSSRACRCESGFTLIEIMVVVVIIGVMLSLASLSLSGDRREDLLREEARRLHALIGLARDDAIVNLHSVGFSVSENSYRFLLKKKGLWQPFAADQVFKQRSLSHGMGLNLEVEGVEVVDGVKTVKLLPAVVFWSSGEVTPFSLLLELDGKQRYRLVVNAVGEMSFDTSTI